MLLQEMFANIRYHLKYLILYCLDFLLMWILLKIARSHIGYFAMYCKTHAAFYPDVTSGCTCPREKEIATEKS